MKQAGEIIHHQIYVIANSCYLKNDFEFILIEIDEIFYQDSEISQKILNTKIKPKIETIFFE